MIKLYNSLAREKQVFAPLDSSHVKVYACGPTVYNYAHIGNARMAVVFDQWVRVLRTAFPKVTYVSNITDVDDKIMQAAVETGDAIGTITEKYTRIYNADMASLGVMFVMSGLIRIVIGADDRQFADGARFIFTAAEFREWTGLTEALALRTTQAITLAATALAVGWLHWFLQRTRTGKSMRAFSDNEGLAQLSGISPERVVMTVWILSATLATLAGLAAATGIALLPLLALGLAAGLAVASLLPLRGRSLRRTPLPVWGMVLAHFGVAVALFGMGSESAFSVERLVAAREGATVAVGPWQIRLAAVDPVAGPNWTALEAKMEASYRGGAPTEVRPQARSFWAPPQQTSESALLTRWNGQLYAVLGEEAEDGRWQLRLWWKPFVPLIWLGGVLIGLGGLLALIGRVWSDLKRIIAKDKIAYRRERQGR